MQATPCVSRRWRRGRGRWIGTVVLAATAGIGARAQTAPAPETLPQAWAIALAANARVKASQRVTEAARHTLDAARGARLPAVNLEGGYTALSHAPAVDIPPLVLRGEDQPLVVPFDRLPVGQAHSWAYQATASLPLYTGGRVGEQIAEADARVNASRAEEAATGLDIKMRVAEAYVGVLWAARMQDVVESEVNSLSAYAADAKNLLDQGMTARNDYLAAQVALADARQRRIRAINALDAARAAYNRMLARPLDYAVALQEPSVALPDGDVATLTARALAQRPEIAALERQAEALARRADGLLAIARPQAMAAGGYTYQENEYQVYPGFWSAGVSVRWNVFDGGVTRAEAAAARSEADALVSRRDDLRASVALDVRRTWLEVNSAERRLEVVRDATVQAEENLRVARDRYTAGLGIATEVLDAEMMRTRSSTTAATATYERILAVLRLRRAVGDL